MDAHARVPQEAFAQAVTPAVAAMANGGHVQVLQDAVVLTCTLIPPSRKLATARPRSTLNVTYRPTSGKRHLSRWGSRRGEVEFTYRTKAIVRHRLTASDSDRASDIDSGCGRTHIGM